MAGIAEALENVCFSNLSMSIPKIETRYKKLQIYFSTCAFFIHEFTKDFEEFIQKRFFDYSTKSAVGQEGNLREVYKLCIRNMCKRHELICVIGCGLDNAFSNAPHWHITVGELNLISKDLKDAYEILNDMTVLR